MNPTEPTPAVETPKPDASRRPGRWRLWFAAVGASVAAAALAGLLGETGRLTVLPADVAGTMMGRPTLGPTIATREAAEVRSVARTEGAFGAFLGLGMGLAGALATGRPRRAVPAGLGGALGGAVAGFVVSFVFLPVFFRLAAEAQGEFLPALGMHAVLWGAVGAAGGAALGAGAGRRGRGLGAVALGGAFGAVLGSVGYDLIGAVAFPLAETSRPIAGTAFTRFLACFLAAVPAAVGAVGNMPAGEPGTARA